MKKDNFLLVLTAALIVIANTCKMGVFLRLALALLAVVNIWSIVKRIKTL